MRLETGLVELQLSNRVQNVSGGSSTMGRGSAAPSARRLAPSSSRPAKLFGRAKVDLNLSLGQLIRNPLFEEAEPEFQQVAFFKTRINLRNAFQDELTPSEGSADVADKEVLDRFHQLHNNTIIQYGNKSNRNYTTGGADHADSPVDLPAAGGRRQSHPRLAQLQERLRLLGGAARRLDQRDTTGAG